MALAAMGLYGLVLYTVKQSTHEIGIRMALGATAGPEVGGFLGRGLRLGAIGTMIGTGAALTRSRGCSAASSTASARPIRSRLAERSRSCWAPCSSPRSIPAWRAASTNPLAALRRS